MIWQTIFNILVVLLRNAFQRGHQCIRLEQDGYFWEWECSCGDSGLYTTNELQAIREFKLHVAQRKVAA